MAKVPVSVLSHSKPNKTSSAWTKLVQTTKTASKTPRHGNTKSPSLRRQSSQTSATSLSGSPRPMKRRRITGPKSQSAPKSAKKLSSPGPVSRHEADHAENLTRVPATNTAPANQSTENVETSDPSKGYSPSPNRKCDSSQPSKRKSAVTGVPSFSPTHSDLRAFWGPAKEGRQSRQGEALQESDDVEAGGAGQEDTAAKSAEGGSMLGLANESNGHETQVERPRQPLGGDVQQNETSDLAQRDITDTNSKVVTKSRRRAPAEDFLVTSMTVTRSSQASSPLRRSSKTRQRLRLSHETGHLDDEDEHRDRAATTQGLHDASYKAGVNSFPDPNQIVTPPSPQSSTSASDDKENAIPARKAKRRLTLHDTQPHHQQKKKRKAAPKQTVQTTLALAIGGNAGMRECKVCDTVYNPLHPEDVKVHAKRHAGVVRKERKYAEM